MVFISHYIKFALLLQRLILNIEITKVKKVVAYARQSNRNYQHVKPQYCLKHRHIALKPYKGMKKNTNPQRKLNCVEHLPAILQTPIAFQLLTYRGRDNYRKRLFYLINEHLSVTKKVNTIKGYYLYPSTIPNQPKFITILEECLNRMLQEQATDLQEEHQNILKEAELNKANLEAIQAVLVKTDTQVQNYENN